MQQSYKTTTTINAPADQVWALINDLANMEVARGMANRVEVSERDGVPLRTLHLTPELGGGVVAEKITLIDHANMRMNYEVVDFGPVQATSYLGFMHFIPNGQSTTLEYEARFVGPDPAALGAMAKGNVAMMIANLEAALAKR